MKKLTNKRGISLIVLVITIIVMIILATAIILSLSSSGIIGKANKAKTDSDNANLLQAANLAAAEWELAKAENPNTDGAKKYITDKLKDQGFKAEEIEAKLNITDKGEVSLKKDEQGGGVLEGSGASAIKAGVQIGDYVDYTPIEKTSTKYESYSMDTSEYTPFKTQTGEDAFKWRYMGIDKEGNALLVADKSSNDYIEMGGPDGYLNGVSTLNEVCEELYSSANGKARSITFDDVNMVLGATPKNHYYSPKQNKNVNVSDNITIGEIIEKYEDKEYFYEEDIACDVKLSDYRYTGTDYKDADTTEYEMIFGNLDQVLLATQCVLLGIDFSGNGLGWTEVLGGFYQIGNGRITYASWAQYSEDYNDWDLVGRWILSYLSSNSIKF